MICIEAKDLLMKVRYEIIVYGIGYGIEIGELSKSLLFTLH